MPGKKGGIATTFSKGKTRAEIGIAAARGDTHRLIHELRVHQIELEMQNKELRRAQAALEESRMRYADLYDFAPLGYFTLDEQGRIIEVNLTGAKQLGIDKGDLIKVPFVAMVVESDIKVNFPLFVEMKLSNSQFLSLHSNRTERRTAENGPTATRRRRSGAAQRPELIRNRLLFCSLSSSPPLSYRASSSRPAG